MTLKRLLVISVLVALLSPLGIQAQGQAISPSIGVSPPLVRESLKPGETKTLTLKLTNYGADPIPLGLTKASISGLNDQGSPELTAQATPRSAVAWITSADTEIILPPSGSRDVSVAIQPPPALAPGGYNAALLFQAKLPSYYFDLDANARVLPALSVAFLINVAASPELAPANLQITRLQTPSVVLASPVPVISEVNNPSSFFIYPDGQLTLKSFFGRSKTIADFKGSVLLPASTRKYIEAYSGTLWPGVYQATLRLTQGGQVLVASDRFFVLPWPYLVGFFILVIWLLAMAGRRRLRKAWQALLERSPSR